MNPQIAAERWAKTWSRAWPRRDAEAIAALYADTAVYRSPAFGDPYVGLAGVRRYLNEELAVEENIECLFGSPIVSGDGPWWSGGPAGPREVRTSRMRELLCFGSTAGAR